MLCRQFDFASYRLKIKSFIGTGPQTNVFWNALDFAARSHEDQWRRSGDPYIMHPCHVALILAEELEIRDSEILAAALLHDTIEDVEEVTPAVMEEKFGRHVTDIVEGCTKVTHYTGDKQAFKKLVHRKIFSGAAAKPEVVIVKLADRLHNLRTLGAMPKAKRQRIAAETLDIYAPLATILGLYDIKRELYDLALAYKFPRQSSKLRVQINNRNRDSKVNKTVDTLQALFDGTRINAQVNFRTKGIWAYYDIGSLTLKKEISTPREIVIETDTRGNCYRILGLLNKIFPPIPRTIRDFIANPKPTGYQGLHAKANIGGHQYLFKICTTAMARRARLGLVKDWSDDNRSRGRFFRELQEMFNILGSDDSVSYRDMITAGGRKEIYTYTPRGHLVMLPIKATVLDFAFRVHTDIGHSCLGAKVGNKRLSPNHRLRDGDIVDINKSQDPIDFAPTDQQHCQTPKARSELSKSFHKRRLLMHQEVGRSVLQQEMQRHGIPPNLSAHPAIQSLFAHYQMAGIDELYLQIGEGRIRLRTLMSDIKTLLYPTLETTVVASDQLNRVELCTIDPVIVKASSCCKPSPLDPWTIGILTDRGALSLHKRGCGQLADIKFQREDAIKVRWQLQATKIEKLQKILFFNAGRSMLFTLLSKAPDSLQIEEMLLLSHRPDKEQDWEITFSCHHLLGLKSIIDYIDSTAINYEFALD